MQMNYINLLYHLSKIFMNFTKDAIVLKSLKQICEQDTSNSTSIQFDRLANVFTHSKQLKVPRSIRNCQQHLIRSKSGESGHFKKFRQTNLSPIINMNKLKTVKIGFPCLNRSIYWKYRNNERLNYDLSKIKYSIVKGPIDNGRLLDKNYLTIQKKKVDKKNFKCQPIFVHNLQFCQAGQQRESKKTNIGNHFMQNQRGKKNSEHNTFSQQNTNYLKPFSTPKKFQFHKNVRESSYNTFCLKTPKNEKKYKTQSKQSQNLNTISPWISQSEDPSYNSQF